MDALKVVAAFAVILIHVTAHVINQGMPSPGVWLLNGIAQWAVPAFFAASGYAFSRRLGRTDSAWRWKRIHRLGLPYAGWSIIYICMLAAMARVVGNTPPTWSVLDVLLLGGAYDPLWFLPTLLYVSLIASFFKTRKALAAATLAALAISIARSALVVTGAELAVLYNYTLSTLPHTFWIFGAGVLVGSSPKRQMRSELPAIVAILLVVGLSIWSALIEANLDEHGYAVAGVLLVLAASGHSSAKRWRLTPYLLGIYLVHSIWLEVFAELVPHARATGVVWVALAVPFVALFSWTSVLVLGQTPLRPLVR